jgi:hypothetical protein
MTAAGSVKAVSSFDGQLRLVNPGELAGGYGHNQHTPAMF